MKKKYIIVLIAFCLISLSPLFGSSSQLQSAEPTMLEQNYRGTGLAEAQELKQFGYDLLSNWQPGSSVLVNGDYIVGPGDQLRIYMWGDPVDYGALQSIYDVAIGSDGGMYLDQMGYFSVFGLKLDQIEKLITDTLLKKYKNISLNIAPTKLRDYTIYITGFVNKPGVVKINGLWSVADVLGLSGGVLSEGSLRSIEVQRKGKTIVVDLYDLFIKGIPLDMYVMEGDVIYVPPQKLTAAVAGVVRRPAIYELTSGETVADILTFGGDLRNPLQGFSTRLIHRIGVDVTIEEGNSLDPGFLRKPLKDGDLLIFSSGGQQIVNMIEVSGQVLYPGIYTVEATPFVSDLIKKIELLADTDKTFATILRQDGEDGKYSLVFDPSQIMEGLTDYELYPGDLVEFYKQENPFSIEPVRVVGEVANPGVVAFENGMTLLDILSSKVFTAPIEDLQMRILRNDIMVAQLNVYDLLVLGDMTKNYTVREGDVVSLVKGENSQGVAGIRVLGQAVNPGVYPFTPGMKISDALDKAGGYTAEAFPQGIVFIRKSVQKQQIEKLQKNIQLTQEQLNSLALSLEAQNLSADAKAAVTAQMAKQQLLLDEAAASSVDALGRIVIDVPQDYDQFKNSEADIALEKGDLLYIPKSPDHITIFGDTASSIALPWSASKRVRDYLLDLGGLRSKDYEISIVKYNGKIVTENSLSSNWSFIENQRLDRGDVIIAIKRITIPAGTALVTGLMNISDTAYKIIYSLNTLGVF